jgi:hypothetical protein
MLPVMDGAMPCVCPDWAAVVRYAPGGCAVVRNAGTFSEMPDELIVALTPLAVSAELRPTKFDPALLAIAVVR